MTTDYEFDFIWNEFKQTVDFNKRSLYLSSMGCIQNESVLKKFIMMIVEDSDINNTENNEWRIILKASYSNNAVGLRVTLQFLRQHYDFMIEL